MNRVKYCSISHCLWIFICTWPWNGDVLISSGMAWGLDFAMWIVYRFWGTLTITMGIYVAMFLSLWQTLSGLLFWERDKRTGLYTSANLTWRTGKVWGAKSSPFVSCCKSCLCACTFHTRCGQRLYYNLYLSQIRYLGIQDKGINHFFCVIHGTFFWFCLKNGYEYLNENLRLNFKMQFISSLAMHNIREK